MTVEHSLFEEGYLLRSLGNVANVPEVAVSELVANAWDAGASRVDIQVPSEVGGIISVADDGTGMTPMQFRARWMKHGYNRVRHQGELAEFPPERSTWSRRAYGRNGIGRHGLLCFSNEYFVETRHHDEEQGRLFQVRPSSGESAFDLVTDTPTERATPGTTIWAEVIHSFPKVDAIRDALSLKFLHDPQFSIYVNDDLITLATHTRVAEELIEIDSQTQVEVLCVEMPPSRRGKSANGVAFWVGGRLVGDPTYSLHGVQLLDGRTTVANRHMIVVKSDDLFNDVQPDWAGFRRTGRTIRMAEEVGAYVNTLVSKLMAGKIQENKTEALRENRDELRKLKPLAQIEITDFVNELVTEHPTLNTDVLTAAVKAAVNLEKSRSGQALLEKLSAISEDDVDRINFLLDNWTLRDALAVLDEIDRRMCVIEAIEKLMGDPHADELHSIHPLVTQARWLFGPEFDSPVFSSNVSIKSAAAKVFRRKIDPEGIGNPRQRPDLVFLKDASVSLTGTEDFDESGSVVTIHNLLVIELKKGDFRITSKEIAQAVQYVLDLLNCGLLDGSPFIRAFVVGQKVDTRCRPQSVGGDPIEGKVEPVSFGQLVRTGRQRLFKLQERVAERYRDVPGLELVKKVLGEPEQTLLIAGKQNDYRSRSSRQQKIKRRV